MNIDDNPFLYRRWTRHDQQVRYSEGWDVWRSSVDFPPGSSERVRAQNRPVTPSVLSWSGRPTYQMWTREKICVSRSELWNKVQKRKLNMTKYQYIFINKIVYVLWICIMHFMQWFTGIGCREIHHGISRGSEFPSPKTHTQRQNHNSQTEGTGRRGTKGNGQVSR